MSVRSINKYIYILPVLKVLPSPGPITSEAIPDITKHK